MIREISTEDTRAVMEIYNHYILNSVITFEETPVAEEEMRSRVEARPDHLPWLVFEEGCQVLGYAYANQWKARSGYRHTAECTIYLHPKAGGRGIGSQLYAELLARLESLGFRSIIGGVALPNAASVALHEKFGFEKVAHFKKVGFKFGQWIDVGYWELQVGME